jgi:hypothetical protein
MIVPLYRWVTKGVRPGGFLEAVIALDWRGAILTADFVNRVALKDFVMLMDDMPPGSTGAANFDSWERSHSVTKRAVWPDDTTF